VDLNHRPLGYEPNDESLSGSDFIEVISAKRKKTAQIARFLCAVCAQLLGDAEAGVRLTYSATDAHNGRLRASMKLRKTVTRAKLEANRMNSKRSTGPRTQRGKRTAKYNALTLGLFATNVVIPICDGDDSDAEFQTLLSGLHQQFQPEGTFEEWFVLKIAACMWRLRRATRCEYGSVRQSAVGDHFDYKPVIADFERQIVILNDAERQLRNSGTLSPKHYEAVKPLVEEQKLQRIQSDQRTDADVDREEFLTCIKNRMDFVQWLYRGATDRQGEREEDHMAYSSLPATHDMNKILGYEERICRQLDWAWQRLVEVQETRKKSASLVAVPQE
jgi:hypothetical protein